MAVATAIDFKAKVQEMFDHFDAQEFAELRAMFADDVQGVDELSRKWLRDQTAISGYFEQLEEMGVGDIHSTLSDVTAKQWDDMALVTCMADQTYSIGGDPVAISAPCSILFRHVGGDWKIELVHAVPLSDQED